ncbi:MAG: four helix bundle protein [Candidatus Taylorbacteria bacterium]|nr:four helix bundle protein [Candidatus Taylorbacteria bacterium]
MRRFRFLDWDVYKDARRLFVVILSIVKKLPKEYRYEIGSQIIRACFSVVLNIAEGSGKHSEAELNRFFDIALGSLFETLAAVDVLRECTLVEEKVFFEVEKLATSISNQLGGFKKHIRGGSI